MDEHSSELEPTAEALGERAPRGQVRLQKERSGHARGGTRDGVRGVQHEPHERIDGLGRMRGASRREDRGGIVHLYVVELNERVQEVLEDDLARLSVLACVRRRGEPSWTRIAKRRPSRTSNVGSETVSISTTEASMPRTRFPRRFCSDTDPVRTSPAASVVDSSATSMKGLRPSRSFARGRKRLRMRQRRNQRVGVGDRHSESLDAIEPPRDRYLDADHIVDQRVGPGVRGWQRLGQIERDAVSVLALREPSHAEGERHSRW